MVAPDGRGFFAKAGHSFLRPFSLDDRQDAPAPVAEDGTGFFDCHRASLQLLFYQPADKLVRAAGSGKKG